MKEMKLFGVNILRDQMKEEQSSAGRVDVHEAKDVAPATATVGTTAVLSPEVRDEVLRKCKSMGNLAAFDGDTSAVGNTSAVDDNGYLSEGGLVQPPRHRGERTVGRKKGIPWTEEEHRTFLAGLEKMGKGDWKGIARNFVTTRTPAQVASHAQKYFLRQSNLNKKRRCSLFDLVLDESAASSETNTSPLAPDTEVVERDNHVSQNNHSEMYPAYVIRQDAPQAPEFTSAFQAPFYPDIRLILGCSASCGGRVLPTFPLIPSLNIHGQLFPVIQANPSATGPLFVPFSYIPPPMPQADTPAQEDGDPGSPSVESSNLNLSTGQPQQHNHAKLSPQNSKGAVRVV